MDEYVFLGAREGAPAAFWGRGGSPALESVDNALNQAIFPHALVSPEIRPLRLPSVLSPCAVACLHLLRPESHDGGPFRAVVGRADVGELRRERDREVPPAVVRRVQPDRVRSRVPNGRGEAAVHPCEIAQKIPARVSDAGLGARRAGGIGVEPENKRGRRNGTKERVATKVSLAEHQRKHVCGHCKDTFWSSRPWAKWCSASCRMRAAYERKWQAARTAIRGAE